MSRTPRLFLVAVLLMPVHIVEQLVFGLDELHELRAMALTFTSSFGDVDFGTVVLVGLVTTVVLFFCYAFMTGGIPRVIAGTFFGLEFMFEGHHIVKTILRGAYFPGAISAVAIVVVGALVLKSTWREFRAERAKPALATASALLLMTAATPAAAQELEPRAYAPSPTGMTFVVANFGKSEGGILYDPSLNIRDVQADLWIATTGVGRTFAVAGRQARILALFPAAWGSLAGNVSEQAQRERLRGLVDPRIKLTVGLAGAPALDRMAFARARRRSATGVSVIVMPPIGPYSSNQLVNLGYNRWAFKPEIGGSYAFGRWTVDGYTGVWLFTTNESYFPGHVVKKQEPLISLQGHVSYSLSPRVWLAVDGTWFAGGETRVGDARSPDMQRNTRLGITLSVPLVSGQSLKFVYSTGAATRRGTDFDSFNVTWQLVRF